jgi:hypothetical protein
MCGNGGVLLMCDVAKCSRSICIGPDAECLDLPVNLRFEDPDVLFICPPCHQDNDRKARKPSPYFVSSTPPPVSAILNSQTYKGFYVVPGPHPTLVNTQTHMASPGSKHEYDTQTLEPLYESPAEIRGSTQLIPRSKFQDNGTAILNFRLDSFHLDTGDLGKILQPFAAAFFPEDGNNSLIFEEIVFDLTQSQHEQKTHSVVERLRAAR